MDRVSAGGGAGMDRCSLNNDEPSVSTGIWLMEVSRKPQIRVTRGSRPTPRPPDPVRGEYEQEVMSFWM
jgi:hypothetical protein